MDNRFRFLGMGMVPRMIISAALWLAGILAQALLPVTVGWILGVGLIIAGMLPLMLKNLTNKPKDQGKEEWRAVTSSEVDRLMDAIKRSSALQARFSGGTAVMGLLLAVLGVGLFMAYNEAGPWATLVVDGALFLLAGVIGGRMKVFLPKQLMMKIDAFRPLINMDTEDSIRLVPYIRFDEDENGKDIPEDLRFQLEKKRAPEDFIGVQFQVAINNGPNGEVPYVYAVALTKGSDGSTAQTLQALAPQEYIVEAGGDDEYGTLVIRQETGGTGYHTTPSNVAHLLDTCVGVLRAL